MTHLPPPFLPLDGHSPQQLFASLRTPCYVIDKAQLRRNASLLAQLSKDTGCKVLLAQKAFSNYDFYPLLENYLAGTEASGLYEARLGREEMGSKEVHVFSAAYREDQFTELLDVADHFVFNSLSQLALFGPRAKAAGKSLGIRINPECSTQEGHDIYDPCAPGSRLGVTRKTWDEAITSELLNLLDGIHFHTLCEQDSAPLKKTLETVGKFFGDILPRMRWINMGGGHHITRPGYDLDTLRECIRFAQQTWKLEVYLEPGEAVALNAGFLVSRVLDVVHNGTVDIAILDASAACHMPDVIEMPYTPPLYDAFTAATADHSHGYRLAGPTCLAGDVIGDFFFPRKLKPGDMLTFGDMAIYTTCKNNTFNGMPLPDIWSREEDGSLRQIVHFGYQDFKGRLGR